MKKILTISSGLLLLLAASCEDGLRSEVYDAYNTTVFPKTVDDVNALLVGGVYAPFRSFGYEGLFAVNNRGVHIYSDMCTDLGDCAWSDTHWFDLINVNFKPDITEGPIIPYNNNINGITRMTNLITTIEGMESISTDDKKKLVAQAKCGRGWLAYILYDMYGGIQIATDEAIANPAKNIIVPRKSAAETAKFIEDDLLDAVKGLPATIRHGDSDYGRFTAGLAYTVLMKLYMHDKRWADAAKIGEELAKPEYGYGLVQNYKDIFTLENEGNEETIWACVEDHGISCQLWLDHVLPSVYPTSNPNIQKFGGYKMPWNFYHTFEAGDKRLETIVAEFRSASGVVYSEANPRGVMDKGAIPLKYGEDPEDTGSGSAVDWIVYRYADVLTLHAEAIARDKGAVTDEAVKLLNRVRKRAGLTEYEVTDFGGLDSFLDAILTERGHEGWFEGWRRSDLIRHGKFVAYAKLYKKSRTADAHHELFPLPQGIINEGRGLVLQNPDY